MLLFENAETDNTDAAIDAALANARKRGIKEIVISSTTGASAQKLLDKAVDEKIIAVTYHCGSREPWQNSMTEEDKRKIEEKGGVVVRTGHALSGVERSFSNKFKGVSTVEVAAATLKIFGQGTKVAIECSLMAADAGALTGEKIIAMGGTHQGVDTALVMVPANQKNFLNINVNEIICKPEY